MEKWERQNVQSMLKELQKQAAICKIIEWVIFSINGTKIKMTT